MASPVFLQKTDDARPRFHTERKLNTRATAHTRGETRALRLRNLSGSARARCNVFPVLTYRHRGKRCANAALYVRKPRVKTQCG